MKKRIISAVLALSLLLTLLPAEALATELADLAETVPVGTRGDQDDTVYQIGNDTNIPDLDAQIGLYADEETVTYTCDNGASLTVDMSGTIISGTPGSNGAVEIPAEIPIIDENGQETGSIPVLTIGYRAFLQKDNLTSVTLPEGLTTLESWAFAHNGNLSSINFPASLTTVKNNAFKFTGFTTITIPSTITYMEYDVFHGCNKLNTAVFEDGVTKIADSTFYGCGALSSVTIPDGVTSIGKTVFRGCSSLKSITIPDSVTSIGVQAFTYSGIQSVKIPGNMSSIGENAFGGCDQLTSVEIPDGVVSIGKEAFSSCRKLTSLKIPDTVTSIGEAAFRDCTSLTSIIIPNNVTSIEGTLNEQLHNMHKSQVFLLKWRCPGGVEEACAVPKPCKSCSNRRCCAAKCSLSQLSSRQLPLRGSLGIVRFSDLLI